MSPRPSAEPVQHKHRDPAIATPAMAQYIELKHANPDCLLFYRMGDFYELFFEDAEIASRALGIALTKRGKHGGEDIAMCGVPVHAADDYLQRLIALNYRVAVCEQLEDPAEAKKRGTKAVVRRDVVRLVTPGTITEETLLDPGQNAFLVAVSAAPDAANAYGLAWVDLSTGLFRCRMSEAQTLSSDLSALEPREIIIPELLRGVEHVDAALEFQGLKAQIRGDAGFEVKRAAQEIANFFEVASLDGVGDFSAVELSAMAGLLAYLLETQRGEKPALSMPRSVSNAPEMRIDAASRANLELTQTLSGNKSGSVLATIDRTITGNGRRLLSRWLAAPLMDQSSIQNRLDAVETLLRAPIQRQEIRAHLKASGDIARALSRLSLGRGGPRDLVAIKQGCETARDIAQILKQLIDGALDLKSCVDLSEAAAILQATPNQVQDILCQALCEDVPLEVRSGGFIAQGYDAGLDEFRVLSTQGKQMIAALQGRLIEETDVKNLKIKHNNVLGYFIEVPQRHGDVFMTSPLNETFIHRQTLANVMRFTTSELSGLQSKISEAGDRALQTELGHFESLSHLVLDVHAVLQSIADALAMVDVAQGLATLAEDRRYVRPNVHKDSRFHIIGGRHPVVEDMLLQSRAQFVANDCDLSPKEGANGQLGRHGAIWLVTGPNMGGKSTFLRQNALIAVLAQMGSFVPAEKADIGLVSQLFCRVGAADDLARGRSTFMVEMVETAAILNQADAQSLVILDELGRGTATFDGLSIAWSSVEHLHNVNKARTLFATHFHELVELEQSLARLDAVTVGVKEWRGSIVFLHSVLKGANQRSYGIQVAKLAGLPAPVLGRAKALLAHFESRKSDSITGGLLDEMPLFAKPQQEAQTASQADIEPENVSSEPDPLEEALENLDPDSLTPRQALEALYDLKRLLISPKN